MYGSPLTSLFILAVALFLSIFTGSPVPSVHVVFTLEDSTFLENIAVRSNGSLVITTIQHPWVYAVDPTADEPIPSILAKFDDGVVNGVTGIAEIAPDNFAVIVANWNLTDETAKNTSIWTFNAAVRPSRPKKAVVLPPNATGNGMTNLIGTPGSVLIADPNLGGVWRVDIYTGMSRLVIQDPTMVNNPNVTGGFPIGINGLHIRDNYLYYTNSKLHAFFRIPIHADGTRAGAAEEIVGGMQGTTSYDDFVFDDAGNAYIAALQSAIVKVTPGGRAKTITGDGVNKALDGKLPTSVAFGHGSPAQEDTLYISTINGTLFAADLSEYVIFKRLGV